MLRATDFIANWQADRFNNHVPKFNPYDLAMSRTGCMPTSMQTVSS